MKKSIIAATVLLGSTSSILASDFVINLDKEVTEKHTIINYDETMKKDLLLKKLNDFKNSKLKPVEVQEIAPITKPVEVEQKRNFIYTNNKKLSQVVATLGDRTGNVYILKDKDILIKDGYKIKNMEELINLVDSISEFYLKVEKTKIPKTYYLKLAPKKDIRKIQVEMKTDVVGLKKFLMNEFGLKMVTSSDILGLSTKVHLFGEYTLPELVEDLETQLNIWFTVRGDKVYVSETKEIMLENKRDGEFTIDFSKASSASTGAESDSETAETGFSFALKDYSAETFLDNLKTNFEKVTFKKSYSGFIVAEVRPQDYKSITDYFKNIEKRHEMITGEIVLLNLKKSNQFKYNLSWSDLLLNQNILNMGSNGTLFLSGLTMGDPTVSQLASEGGTAFGIQSTTANAALEAGETPSNIGLMEALKGIGEVSIVDKWEIASATGVPTGFTNYQKVPYYTTKTDNTNTDAGTTGTTTDELHYALTGFKSTFNVRKTKEETYILDGAIDFSGITGWKTGSQGNDAPEISGKTMRVYTELQKLGQTIVVGGFKNLQKSKDDTQTPLLGDIPGLGWLFKQKDDQNVEEEFIILISLDQPEIYEEKEAGEKYAEFGKINDMNLSTAQDKRDNDVKKSDFLDF